MMNIDSTLIAERDHEPYKASVFVVHSLEKVSECLFHQIHRSLTRETVGSSFTIALSGGSLPTFLVRLPEYFASRNIDPHWEKWHVLLADERLVPLDHPDSNLRLLKETLLNHIPMIPPHQIHGINYELLSIDASSTVDVHNIAQNYQSTCLMPLFEQRSQHTPYLLDCVLLGFGPDGHTCSLFPSHELLKEKDKWVAALTDSPKLPKHRITLTLPVLNYLSRDIIFVGIGTGKKVIIQNCFKTLEPILSQSTNTQAWTEYQGILEDYNKTGYPCALVRPVKETSSLSWIIDDDAAPIIL